MWKNPKKGAYLLSFFRHWRTYICGVKNIIESLQILSMTGKQENKLSMIRATEEVLNKNQSKWSGKVLFVTVKTAFSTKIEALQNARQRQLDIITGITVDKKELRKLMMEKAESVATKLAIYAEDTNDNELVNEVNLSRLQLDRARDEAVAGLCQNIHDHATKHIADLAPYEIDADMLATLQSAIQVYSAKAPQPRAAKAAKKAVTAGIVTLLEDIDKILKNRLDKLMREYKSAEPEFYNAYKAARILIKLGSTHTNFRLQVKDSAGNAVEGATASLLQNNRIIYNLVTDANGKLAITKMKPGTYDIKIAKTGLLIKTETGVEFKAGKEVKRVVSLSLS